MMILLAVLLLAAAAVLTVVVVTQGSDPVAFEVLGRDLDTSAWVVFLAGVVAGLIVLAGIGALADGIRRRQARRREVEYLRQRVAQQEDTRTTTATDTATDDAASAGPAGNGPDQGRGRRKHADMS